MISPASPRRHSQGPGSNDDNLNIRRYADNAPPPEPHDVRAHLYGGVPNAELEAKRDLFETHGLDPAHFLKSAIRSTSSSSPHHRQERAEEARRR